MAEKTLFKREEQPFSVIKIVNLQWALDIIHDALYFGKRIKVRVRALNILTKGARECLTSKVNTSLPAEQIIRRYSATYIWRL